MHTPLLAAVFVTKRQIRDELAQAVVINAARSFLRSTFSRHAADPVDQARYHSLLMHKRRDFAVRSSKSMTEIQQKCKRSKPLRNDCLASDN